MVHINALDLGMFAEGEGSVQLTSSLSRLIYRKK
jgi:hypothetical protein